MKPKCTWSENFEGQWETECGNCFEFTTGGPSENGAKYCMYCGKALAEGLYVPEGADYE